MKKSVENANRIASAKMAIKYALNVFNCKSTDELKDLCTSLISAINFVEEVDAL